MELKDLLPYQLAFENYLEQENLSGFIPATLFSPVSYILSLAGKRIRPLLTLLSGQLFNDSYTRVLPQALAVEIFHNFTLMHDDIMDQAPTRRGQASTHKKYGVNAAILSGDAMLIMSYQYLMRGLSEKQVIMALALFSEVALDICKGQQLDMDFEQNQIVEIEDYLDMIKKKTAVLIGLSMSLGAIVHEADQASVNALQTCGEAAGMAFQIQDDYLDAFGDSKLTGKQRGGDIIQNKKTYLWLKAWHLGGERIQRELMGLYSQHPDDPADKVRRVIDIYRALEVESHCRNLQIHYTNQAIDALNQVQSSEESRQQIFDMMVLLLGRNH